MNIISSLFQFEPSSACRRYPALLVASMLPLFFCCAGCGKSGTPDAQAPTPVTDTNLAAVNQPGPPVSTPEPVEIAANPDGGVDLKALNHAYTRWIVQTRQAPSSFENYVALSGVKVPPPPPGKKYVIDKNGFINLATK